jgi:hypothetical protein
MHGGRRILAELRGDLAGARSAQEEALAAAARIGLEPEGYRNSDSGRDLQFPGRPAM